MEFSHHFQKNVSPPQNQDSEQSGLGDEKVPPPPSLPEGRSPQTSPDKPAAKIEKKMIKLVPPKPDQMPCVKKKRTKPKSTPMSSTVNNKKISSWFKKIASTEVWNANTSENSAPIAPVLSTSVHRINFEDNIFEDNILPRNEPDLAEK